MRTEIAKWGNSLALRLPRSLAADAGLAKGTVVDLRIEGDKLIIAPARPRYRLADLLSKITPDNRHDEVDWGAPEVRRSGSGQTGGYQPDRGHFIYLDFTPHAGTQRAGRRPALVLYPIQYNVATGRVFACPVTN